MKKVDNSKSNSKKKNKELIKRTDVKDSPFTIIEINGKYFGSMGKYRITEEAETKEEIEKELNKITWNRLIQVMSIIFENLKNAQ